MPVLTSAADVVRMLGNAAGRDVPGPADAARPADVVGDAASRSDAGSVSGAGDAFTAGGASTAGSDDDGRGAGMASSASSASSAYHAHEANDAHTKNLSGGVRQGGIIDVADSPIRVPSAPETASYADFALTVKESTPDWDLMTSEEQRRLVLHARRMANIGPHRMKPGETRNPNGRPKGSIVGWGRRLTKFAKMTPEELERYVSGTLLTRVRQLRSVSGNELLPTDEKNTIADLTCINILLTGANDPGGGYLTGIVMDRTDGKVKDVVEQQGGMQVVLRNGGKWEP